MRADGERLQVMVRLWLGVRVGLCVADAVGLGVQESVGDRDTEWVPVGDRPSEWLTVAEAVPVRLGTRLGEQDIVWERVLEPG